MTGPSASHGTASTRGSGRAIADAFARARAEERAALIPYICAGYRSLQESVQLLDAAADAGADVLEVGVPFSDPLADGPTIQRASFRALENGTTTRSVLEMVRTFRRRHRTPVVLFTYLNPILRFGVDAFLVEARRAGADGLLVTDLPAGADVDLEERIEEGGLDLIRLAAPTTSLDRIEDISARGRGFLYYISRTGVTGRRASLRGELAQELSAVREKSALPVAVGFGISTPEQAAAVAARAEGVVVGSALVEALDEGGVEGAARFLRSLADAMHREAGAP